MTEPQIWGLSLAAILALGHLMATRDRAKLPEQEREKYKLMGYIPAVTRTLSPQSARIMCAALAIWLLCLGLRLLWVFCF